jgi:hypothetical protein
MGIGLGKVHRRVDRPEGVRQLELAQRVDRFAFGGHGGSP